MNKVTKRPKSTKVKWKRVEQIAHISEYTCPTCKVIFRNTIPSLYKIKITRFVCDCGQGLIIK